MSEPFLGEIKLVSFNPAPDGFAFCNGQLLPISQYPDLFKVLSTTYGGDGVTNFALPNLQGRAPVHSGDTHPLGQSAGTETASLTTVQMPQHQHTLYASATSASTADPTNSVVAKKAKFGVGVFTPANHAVPMAKSALVSIGATQAHDNMQPYLTLNFVIAVQGLPLAQN